MFVQFRLNAVAVGEPQEDFATFFTTASCIIFPMHAGLEKSRVDDQGVCPGNYDNEEVPISYSIIKDALGNMGVIYQ
jgi:hypothetical protein